MKTIDFKPESGPDAGNTYVIKRMSAFAADKWARHLIKGLARAGAKLDDKSMDMGITGLAGVSMAVYGELEDSIADKSFADLLACVKVRPEGSQPGVEPRALMEADLQDPETLQKLYAKAFELHVDFLKAAAYLISPLATALMPNQENEQNQ